MQKRIFLPFLFFCTSSLAPCKIHIQLAPKFHRILTIIIPIALQISALAYGGVGVFGKGFGGMDAVLELTWTYSRRPLTGTPTPKFD
ncbi:hypothetical protein EQU24_09815 [Methylotuvimicrobium buryatense]|uniref:Uncharacterized protein n=1 Tax=Methylotuvimicrobium buryatense TaxID=95641 RepID=A0A4P9UML4_METBY|nr:hypothetical protein EQU24_09815 [Methylotuvimicrobium buryatense]